MQAPVEDREWMAVRDAGPVDFQAEILQVWIDLPGVDISRRLKGQLLSNNKVVDQAFERARMSTQRPEGSMLLEGTESCALTRVVLPEPDRLLRCCDLNDGVTYPGYHSLQEKVEDEESPWHVRGYEHRAGEGYIQCNRLTTLIQRTDQLPIPPSVLFAVLL